MNIFHISSGSSQSGANKGAYNLHLKLKKKKIKNNFEILNICCNRPLKIINIIKKINKYFKNFSVNDSQMNKVEV